MRPQPSLFQTKNLLYYGDNLVVLKRQFADESVDLVYLDPPFNSGQSYNLLFTTRDGNKPTAQQKAFDDTWHWNQSAWETYRDTVRTGPEKVSQALQAFHGLLGPTDMLAYLSMMAPRLVELRRVLRRTGSLYLHCDLTASHYLKLLMDAVFGAENFVNEIAWKRTSSHGNVARNYGSICDTILFYAKSPDYTWNQQFTQFPVEYVEATFKFKDPDGRRWQSVTLRNPSPRPNLQYPYTASNGETYQPHPNGWVCDEKKMRRLDKEGRLHFPTKPTGALRLKMYLDESNGVKLQNLWTDFSAVGSRATERIHYPTQKPLALLARIIASSSNPGDVVLDPFCGCGTAIEAAQDLARRWIGIDVAKLAVEVIKDRLVTAYGEEISKTYEVVAEPASVEDALALAEEDKYEFQWWALREIGAAPAPHRKGADRGVDGRLYFHDEIGGETQQVVVSVKGGSINPGFVRDLRGVIEREGAAIGLMITAREPTLKMRQEASEAGDYYSEAMRRLIPRLQFLTVADILEGKSFDYPHVDLERPAPAVQPTSRSTKPSDVKA